jgi:hypothetical protein
LKYDSLYERLIANSEKPEDQNENGCWLWTAGQRKGYGRLNVYVEGRTVTRAAHREMENQFRSERLPPSVTLDHLCGNTLCVNPDHWNEETNEENARLSQQRNPRSPFVKRLPSAK